MIESKSISSSRSMTPNETPSKPFNEKGYVETVDFETSTDEPQLTGFAKWKDSFRRQPSGRTIGEQLQKGISKRHLILMALVTGIGTGLFVGAGSALSNAGPLFLIIAYIVIGSMIYPTLQSAGEMAVNYSELSGGYNNYPRKFVDPAVAFATSWNYFIQWISIISLELVVAAMTIQYWSTSINPDVWVAVVYIVINFINYQGAKGYGEAEFIIGSIKITMIVGFIIMALVINLGGGPEGIYIGGKFWHDPGFHTNFKGLVSVFITASFSYSMSELVALSAAEQKNPRKSIPLSCKLMAWRIILFFLGSLTMVGLLVPYNSPRLLGSGSGDTSASPFVLAAELHGVKVVPHIINAVICLSVTSVGSSALYSASRTLQSLADQGFAPDWFNYIDKAGRPLRSLLTCSALGLFAFIAAYEKQDLVFQWLLAISGLSQLFTWFGICLSHIRFRRALAYNNISLNSLGYISSTGIWGSYYAMTWHVLIIVSQFYIALFPVGGAAPTAENFFKNFLGAIFFLALYFGYKIYYKDWQLYIRTKDIDINADRTIFDEEVLNLERQEEADRYRALSLPMRVIHILFF